MTDLSHSPDCCPDPDKRWELHVEASCVCDFTFWVRQNEDGRWVATEVETGVSGPPADSAREALDFYWLQGNS